jgi:glyoxylase-like metal-dependent hydrolase (beta-lactamase superfamily II)
MQAGTAVRVADGVRRILAPNPSPMTGPGTNSYLIGQGGGLLLVDPGPDDPRHLTAIMAALTPGERITAIAVTHAHLDHSALAPALSRLSGAPVHAFGAADAGRSAVMAALAAQGMSGGGEGVDTAFRPDIAVQDGQRMTGDWGEVMVLHTPGHMGCHISLVWEGVLFSGDLVMGWASSLVSPPDGDMGAYMAQLRRLQAEDYALALPGHGAEITAPHQRIEALIDHRLAREAQVLEALSRQEGSARDLASRIYTDVAPALLPAASRNVLAHLIDLEARNLVVACGPTGPATVFSRR